MVNVDDFKLSGPQQNFAEAWKLIGDVLEVDPPIEPELFLGCLHEAFQTIIDGSISPGIIHNMESNFYGTVMKYCDNVYDLTGQNVNLADKSQAATPFSPEDQKGAPAGKPISNSRAVLRPHCESFFPVWNYGSDQPARICGIYGINNLKKGCYPIWKPDLRIPKGSDTEDTY